MTYDELFMIKIAICFWSACIGSLTLLVFRVAGRVEALEKRERARRCGDGWEG